MAVEAEKSVVLSQIATVAVRITVVAAGITVVGATVAGVARVTGVVAIPVVTMSSSFLKYMARSALLPKDVFHCLCEAVTPFTP